MKIQLLLTGGTIDKHYVESDGSMGFADSHIKSILDQGRSRSDINIEHVMFKDSLDMTDADRELLSDKCKTSESNHILITHGTDTMVQTANHIAKAQPELLKQKVIVLVGAMIPYEIRYSDAEFNLGFALGALNTASAGIYIAMNGTVFSYDNVRKNLEKGAFETL